MTKKHILNQEQIEAHREDARRKNPNKDKIAALDMQIAALSAERSSFISDEEKYCNLAMILSAKFDSRIAAIKCMANQELCEHLINAYYDAIKNEFSEGVLDEVLVRLDYKSDIKE